MTQLSRSTLEPALAVLTYVTFICQDVARLADFYCDLLGLQEIVASRSESYREAITGGSKLGFAASGAYAVLNLPPRSPGSPVNAVLSFDVGSLDQVDALTLAAVAAGARLVKGAWRTPFGQYQSALLDSEGNVFRISAACIEAVST